jgi:outer membrane efflux protein
METSRLALEEQQTTLYTTIESYWIQAVNNQAKYKSALANTESQQTSYELLSEQFRLGLKNITELREAKENLLVAQQNELQSKYLALYNMQMLNFYNGK